jgi:carbon monoxide dehydrogenase subunit G
MLKIDTGFKPVRATPQVVYAFLSDMNNLQKLMPDQVINWKSDLDSCTYTIKGMADIGMIITDRNPTDTIKMKSHGKVPFEFTLNFQIRSSNEFAETSVVFEGELNPFLKMMVEKPLTNFFTMLADGLGKEFK